MGKRNRGLLLIKGKVWLAWGLLQWLSGKRICMQCRRHRRCGFNSWVGKIPWSRKWQPTPVCLPGESHGQRILAGCSPWGRRVRHNWAHGVGWPWGLKWGGKPNTRGDGGCQCLTFCKCSEPSGSTPALTPGPHLPSGSAWFHHQVHPGSGPLPPLSPPSAALSPDLMGRTAQGPSATKWGALCNGKKPRISQGGSSAPEENVVCTLCFTHTRVALSCPGVALPPLMLCNLPNGSGDVGSVEHSPASHLWTSKL